MRDQISQRRGFTTRIGEGTWSDWQNACVEGVDISFGSPLFTSKESTRVTAEDMVDSPDKEIADLGRTMLDGSHQEAMDYWERKHPVNQTPAPATVVEAAAIRAAQRAEGQPWLS